MDEFLRRLEIALSNLPGNPKPSCKGFYLSDTEMGEAGLVTEKIGIVPAEKDEKYLQFSKKKVLQTIEFKAIRSKEFEDYVKEQYPGAIQWEYGCTGVSGHDALVDEAISALWRIHRSFIRDFGTPTLFSTFSRKAAQFENKYTPDNTWVSLIAERMIMVN